MSRTSLALVFGAALVGATLIAPMAAMATITTATSPVFQQTENSPCVIGNTSCKNGGFVDIEFSGTPGGNNGSTYDAFSPNYIVGAGSTIVDPNIIPSSFTIGIDENIAAGQSNEVLQAFNTYFCTAGTTTSGSLIPPGSIPAGCVLNAANSLTGPVTIPNQNNGNGFSDLILAGFSIPVGTDVVFQAIVSNDTDGMEQFFLIPAGTPAVPEPATLMLLGLGLAGVAGAARWGHRRG